MTTKLSPEQRKALDEHNGRPIVVVDQDRRERFMLIAEADYRLGGLTLEANGNNAWTETDESRRRNLIDRDIAGTITDDERTELAILDHRGNAHYDLNAPRPTEGVRRLHDELVRKRDSQ